MIKLIRCGKMWFIEDKFTAHLSHDKPKFPIILFCNKWVQLFPVNCERSGKLIGWRTTVDKKSRNKYFPAFFSFNEVKKAKKKY
jgi:hypothetical protein